MPAEVKHDWACTVRFEPDPSPVVVYDTQDEKTMTRTLLDIALANKKPGAHVFIGMRAVDTDPLTLSSGTK
jgi:hypothetical protein